MIHSWPPATCNNTRSCKYSLLELWWHLELVQIVFAVTINNKSGIKIAFTFREAEVMFLKNKVGHALGECFTLLGFLLQCRLRCRPGQERGHQEAEQTLPEPDPCQEGVPGAGAHEMRQSQKCR